MIYQTCILSLPKIVSDRGSVHLRDDLDLNHHPKLCVIFLAILAGKGLWLSSSKALLLEYVKVEPISD